MVLAGACDNQYEQFRNERYLMRFESLMMGCQGSFLACQSREEGGESSSLEGKRPHGRFLQDSITDASRERRL